MCVCVRASVCASHAREFGFLRCKTLVMQGLASRGDDISSAAVTDMGLVSCKLGSLGAGSGAQG